MSTRPAILNNFLQTPEDRQIAIAGIRRVREIMQQPAMSRYAPDEIMPTAATESNDDILAYARKAIGSVFHPVGTCKMGNDQFAVTDDRLRVHGISGLRVVDASIMPTITSGNTNAPVIMIGEKAADMIIADRRAS
ncbi:Oxygen-dependent choline dehydrogenase [compost metagenome]